MPVEPSGPLRLDARDPGFAQAFAALVDARREADEDVSRDVAAILKRVRAEVRHELADAFHGRGRRGERRAMSSSTESGNVTGTKDKDYNLIWFTEQCLSNALRLETYIQDAERDGDGELVELFRKAQAESRKGAEQGKQLLRSRLSR